MTSITSYNKLIEYVDENSPAVSQENYGVQMLVVCIWSPIGYDSNVTSLASTRDKKARSGTSLVRRGQKSMAYRSHTSGFNDDNVISLSSKNQRRKII